MAPQGLPRQLQRHPRPLPWHLLRHTRRLSHMWRLSQRCQPLALEGQPLVSACQSLVLAFPLASEGLLLLAGHTEASWACGQRQLLRQT